MTTKLISKKNAGGAAASAFFIAAALIIGTVGLALPPSMAHAQCDGIFSGCEPTEGPTHKGYTAGYNGEDMGANPYSAGTFAAIKWFEGWGLGFNDREEGAQYGARAPPFTD